jgi:acyl-homoserine-lactone acylase
MQQNPLPGGVVFLQRLVVVIPIVVAACGPIGSLTRPVPMPGERLARTVTIVRDGWGVPTIYGPTDAAVVFGLAYAQAEDNFWQIEEDYIHALGRASHYYGERYLEADLVKRAFEVERLSREEYDLEPADRKALWEAFTDGLNYYVRTRTGVEPRLIARFEPWMPFALYRTVTAGTVVDGVRLGGVGLPADGVGSGASQASLGSPGPPIKLVGAWDEAAVAEGRRARAGPAGSNMWAIAPARTAAGHALLFQNPHVGFFGSGQRYEMHVHSESGWHVRGFAMLGTPVPRAGHNESLAWSHTNTGADHADVYAVAFDHAADPLLYRYDGEWRRAAEWEDTVMVNTPAGVEARGYRFRRTHQGPVVAERDGRALAVRVARMAEGGSLQQWYAMGRATDLASFRAALAGAAFPISNTMYADRSGSIGYVHGNAVPRRDPAFDWTRPVDGNTAATEWRGYHDLDELPQLLDPAAGWLQNTNSTPFLATAGDSNIGPAAYPAYMAPEQDNARARSSRRLLEGERAWTLDMLVRAAFDTYVMDAGDEVARLVREWEEVGGQNPNRAMLMDEALEILREWDHRSTVESEAMTLYVAWQERLRPGGGGAFPAFRALEEAVTRLQRDFSSVRVPWGHINRLQRVHTSGREPFRDDVPSFAVPGAEGWTGVIFRFTAPAIPSGRRYGVSGHTWVSVVELGPEVRSRSVVQFGQSADPASRHYFDQAPLYSRGELKPAWFTRDDVHAHAARAYRPGGHPVTEP